MPLKNINVQRIGHTIHAVEDNNQARRLYLAVLGAWVFSEPGLGFQDADNALMYLGDHMFETMAPRHLDQPSALVHFLNRYGPGYHSTHFMVDDMEPVKDFLDHFKIATIGEPADGFFYTHPKSTGGFMAEISAIPMPGDPQNYMPEWNPDWAHGQPSTFKNLASINLALPQMDLPKRILTEGLGGNIIGEDTVSSPEPMERCFIAIADQVFCICVPQNKNAGPISQYMETRSPGVYSLTWKVGDLGIFRAHAEETRLTSDIINSPLTLRSDICATGVVTIDPDTFLGARHEFTETLLPS